ncbi:AraC family transcriptional regulator [Paenibacillus sp. GCM10028914]|uniref:AraC family transcriptional regulator n=1 Tax=Paenibacillus sp. GCM10028914 TaxID=3273416 RepID=UPI00361F8327
MKDITSIEKKRIFSSLTMKLWNIEVMKPESVMEQQLTLQPVLIVLLKGVASLGRADRTTRMRKDTVYFCPSHTTFGVSGPDGNSVSVAILYFGFYEVSDFSSRKQLVEVNADTILLKESEFTLSSSDRLSLVCRSIYDHFHSEDDFEKWRSQLEFQEMLYELVTSSSLGTKGDKKKGLEQTREYIDNHYNEELTIDHLAKIADLSPKYFIDIFKKTYGQSAMEYLTEVRMSKAKQLMLGSSRILKDVAHMVGYKDEFYFSRKFKKEFGLSPSAYIKKRKNKLAVYGSSSLLGYLKPLNMVPYAAPLHPKWSKYYYHTLGPDIPVHLDGFRLNHNKNANLEKLHLSQPELIICSQGLELWEKERLQQIAPIYELPPDSEGWEYQLRWIAHLLDKDTEAERWIESYHTQLLSSRRETASTLRNRPTLLTARLHDYQLESHRSLGMEEVLFDNLQFTSPKWLENQVDDIPLSTEMLKEIDADYIVMLVRQDSETLEYWRKLQSTSDWMMIPAVREGRFHLLPSYPWREYSPIALEQMVGEAIHIFSEECP